LTPQKSSQVRSTRLLIASSLFLTFTSPDVNAQPGFNPGDVVTFTDSRDVTSVDITDREVVFATTAGLWFFDRFSGEPHDPEYSGYGAGRAARFGRVNAVLFHHESSTLWISTQYGLFVRYSGYKSWREVPGYGADIFRLGERNDTLFYLIGSSLKGIAVFGYRDLGMLHNVGTEGIRWSAGRSGDSSQPPLPFYHSNDHYLRFDPDKGRLVDWDFTSYQSEFYSIDREYSRRYIGFPGLGFGFGDDRRGSIEVFQPGPAGKGVRAIAVGENGVLYLGGESDQSADGLNRFDRRAGKWERYGRRERWGLETRRIYDLAYHKGKLYVASQEGLLVGSPLRESWGIYGLLDGAPLPPIWLVEPVGDWLFIGGRSGIRKMMTPNGPFFDVKAPGNTDIYAAEGVSEGDTLWLAGPGGVLKGGVESRFEYIDGDEVMGDMPARTIAVTGKTVAVGGSDGLRFFDRYTHEWRAMKGRTFFGGGQVISLAAKDDRFFIGTDRGLYQYDDHTGTLLPFGLDQGLPFIRVDKLLVEADTLWVGTRAGLTRINLNGHYWN